MFPLTTLHVKRLPSSGRHICISGVTVCIKEESKLTVEPAVEGLTQATFGLSKPSAPGTVKFTMMVFWPVAVDEKNVFTF